MMYLHLRTCLFLTSLHFTVVYTALVQMRVVKDTANYGSFGNIYGDTDNTNQLYTSIPPANFSGPTLLKRLDGKCYNLTQERYKYELCPFQNITQYEISPRWNAYHGILG
ncbi:N-acetylglucosamine-1-phosphotransferase subunit gamma-like [Stegodyphus dumicola]|uniref:N-acetylglucosamine-1-phosphotransferase subunit gamma-like n=1 Tax=Stegodyphus dumicola TaxID=202533 RepID=UPI0015A869A5|nr:N-acetylglucosamine-1-phosphotransferase subunit gamma-like [Stegodyphus dumicola]